MSHHPIKTVAVSYATPESLPAAKAWAARLGYALLDDPTSVAAQNYAYVLVQTPRYLGIMTPCQPGKKPHLPFYIDFLSGKMLHRARQASLRKEALARALGCHPREGRVIIDATAGLGRDSFILASLGFKMVLLERSPIVYALLYDALNRARHDPRTCRAADETKMQLVLAESTQWLAQSPPPSCADIIYLDPMFAEKQKSASSKKEISLLRDLLGTGDEQANHELLKAALACAANRVVVKRHRLAASLTVDGKGPHFNLKGKSCRFDVYLCK
jgi:16S rRNA (guanine1516-N2)-methyltransferase